MNVDIEVFAKLIKTIRESIEFLEANDTDNADNADLDDLKLLLSDNLSEEGNIHIRPSLLNIKTHHYFSNYTDYLKRYKKECLCN